MDLEPFLETAPGPLPNDRLRLFVGVLERYKAVDVLSDAWRLAASRVPDATLHLVGRGTLRNVPLELVAELPMQTRWTESLSTPEVARALDDATVLVLPSRSEGLGPCGRRGVLPRPRRRRESRRRDPGHRRGRNDRPARSARER
jgi:glycosyltransferase involved in cell wall biosynthesis